MENTKVAKVFKNKIGLGDIIKEVIEQLGYGNETKVNVMQEFNLIKHSCELMDTFYNEFEEFKKVADEKFEKVEDFTDCLFNHPDIKKKLENHIHISTYRHTGDPTEIKDKLFHSTITRSCKSHITDTLKASSFDRIEISDADKVKDIVNTYMTHSQVDYLINKKIKKWEKEKKKGSLRCKVAVDLLDKYIDKEAEKYANDLEEKLKMM